MYAWPLKESYTGCTKAVGTTTQRMTTLVFHPHTSTHLPTANDVLAPLGVEWDPESTTWHSWHRLHNLDPKPNLGKWGWVVLDLRVPEHEFQEALSLFEGKKDILLTFLTDNGHLALVLPKQHDGTNGIKRHAAFNIRLSNNEQVFIFYNKSTTRVQQESKSLPISTALVACWDSNVLLDDLGDVPRSQPMGVDVRRVLHAQVAPHVTHWRVESAQRSGEDDRYHRTASNIWWLQTDTSSFWGPRFIEANKHRFHAAFMPLRCRYEDETWPRHTKTYHDEALTAKDLLEAMTMLVPNGCLYLVVPSLADPTHQINGMLDYGYIPGYVDLNGQAIAGRRQVAAGPFLVVFQPSQTVSTLTQFLGLPSEIIENRVQPMLTYPPPPPTTTGKKALVLCYNRPADQHNFLEYIGEVLLQNHNNWTIHTLDKRAFHPAFQDNAWKYSRDRHIVADMWSDEQNEQCSYLHGMYATVFMLDCHWLHLKSLDDTIKMIGQVLPVVAVEGSLHVLVAMLRERALSETVFLATLAERIGDAFVVSRRVLDDDSESLIVVVKRVRADVAK